jgi:hypothetical protein
VPPVIPINWNGWTAVGGATATLSEDGSRVLIRCPLTPGLCGFTHGFEDQMTVKIETSFDPQWGSALFGLVPSPGANPIGILNTFSQSTGWAGVPNKLPIPHVYWMRIKDGWVSYSSDNENWYPQVQASGDQAFIGCKNGGAFWLDLVQ